MGHPLRTISVVTSVRITLSSCWAIHPVMASLSVTSTVPVRLVTSLAASETFME